MTWTTDMERRFRAELERRFRARTPPTRIDEVLPEYRVGRSEMRAWAIETLGRAPLEAPEDTEADTRRARWFRALIRRVESEGQR